VIKLFESKEKKLREIMKDGRAVILAFDHAVEHGPNVYEGIDISPERIAKIAEEGKVDGIIVHIGVAKRIKKIVSGLPIIVKITARTSLTPDENQIQQIVTSVKEAKDVGAKAIACTIYFGSDREAEMLKIFEEIKQEANKYKMPIFGFAYPRGKKLKSKYDPDAIRYAARVGAEIGFDVVKTYYTGDKESFSKVVKDCFVPVLVAGGPKISDEKDVLKIVEDVMSVGAAGVAIGRNVWMRKDEEAINLLKEIRRIVHK
jgi:DhnA family fructose-bisphosphate aldolase class Ia